VLVPWLNATLQPRLTAADSLGAMLGLLPVMLGSGTGFDVMQRIAAPMVGGMLTTTVLRLLILPVIYTFVLQYQERSVVRTSIRSPLPR
jgi:Cu(I)/Ag(I) efflux system membrane protein CusA/SilA